MNQDMLREAFEQAKESNASFVFVGIEAEGIKEIIVVPSTSFEPKQAFYSNAYNDELVHVMNSKVRIVSLSHGSSDKLNELI
ncbi:hypothetical protein MKX54_11055 [Alkalihalobacillus sp. FSL R5-0424]